MVSSEDFLYLRISEVMMASMRSPPPKK